MKDGSDLRGLIKLTSGNKIKFKKTKKDKKQTLDYKRVTRVKFHFEEEYLYKITKKRKKIILIKREIKGKLNLYSLISQSSGIPIGNPGAPVIGAYTTTVYYVGKKNNDYIEELPSITNKKFIEILSKYASDCSDCSDFINKIKDKDSINYFFEKKEKEFKGNFESKDAMLEDIINYYNSTCS